MECGKAASSNNSDAASFMQLASASFLQTAVRRVSFVQSARAERLNGVRYSAKRDVTASGGARQAGSEAALRSRIRGRRVMLDDGC